MAKRGNLLSVLWMFAAIFFAAGPLWALDASVETSVLIRGVYLKNSASDWVKIIEPDRLVDLSREEASVRFFNNTGRVPAGDYQNFRVDYTLMSRNEPRSLSARVDFKKAVRVDRGSFIYVLFEPVLDREISVRRAVITVNEDNREFFSRDLTIGG